MSDSDIRMTITGPNGVSVETTAARLKEVAEQLKRKRGVPPMKADPTFDAASDNAYKATAADLSQIIERIERIEADEKDLKADKKEFYAEAKGRGYDTKVIRKLIALRKRDKDDIAEEEAVLEMYKAALGMN